MAPSAIDEYEDDYHAGSDTDGDYDRGLSSPTYPGEYTSSSPIESDAPRSSEQTPTRFNRPGSAYQSPMGKITTWTAEQCADFIADLGLEKYANAFVEDDVSGEAIISLHHEELKDLGIASVGHRLTVLKSVYELKIKQGISVEPDDYVPASAEANAPDAHATQDDIARITRQIHLRDDRAIALEQELRDLKDYCNRVYEESRKLREDILPYIRMAKDQNQPLPTPEGLKQTEPLPSPQERQVENKPPPSSGLQRKYSNKKLWLNNKIPSPTIHENSSLDPSAAAKAASSQLTASMSSHGSQQSPHLHSQQPSPTSPPYNQASLQQPQQSARSGPPSSRYAAQAEEAWSHSQYATHDRLPERDARDRERNGLPSSRRTLTNQTTTTPNATSNSNTPETNSTSAFTKTTVQTPSSAETSTTNSTSSPSATEFMKSFKVGMDEPCRKVLPIALKKYQIQDDWTQYSLYIVHGDQERCLGLDEKPLMLFKQLANEGKRPMFMLRKHATPTTVQGSEGMERGGSSQGYGGQSSGGGYASGGSGYGTASDTRSVNSGFVGGGGRTSYAGSTLAGGHF